MVKLSVKVTGLDELKKEFSALVGSFDGVIEAELHKEAQDYKRRVEIRHRRGPHTGRRYARGGRVHQASAPGQPPAPDTGTLLRSITIELGDMRATVGSRLPYSMFLEFGTRHMAARPMWLPEAVRSRKRLPRAIEAALRARL